MTVIPETASDSDNEEEQGQNQQGQGEGSQAGVTRQVSEGTEQVQDQGNTGTTDGQEEHQNNGPTERQQDQTTAQVTSKPSTNSPKNEDFGHMLIVAMLGFVHFLFCFLFRGNCLIYTVLIAWESREIILLPSHLNTRSLLCSYVRCCMQHRAGRSPIQRRLPKIRL